jgi:two-component SAPR family response regulator
MDLSVCRKKILSLYSELRKPMERLLTRKPFIKGSVYELKRKCGKRNCICQKGDFHKAIVISWSEGGRHYLKTVKIGELNRIKKLTNNYRAFRKARGRVNKIVRQIQEIADEIEKGLLKLGR